VSAPPGGETAARLVVPVRRVTVPMRSSDPGGYEPPVLNGLAHATMLDRGRLCY
jgi:hypothetical protein